MVKSIKKKKVTPRQFAPIIEARAKILSEIVKTDKSAESCFNLTSLFFQKEPYKVYLWFFVENPMLGNIRPIDMIFCGRSEKLLQFIQDQKEAAGW